MLEFNGRLNLFYIPVLFTFLLVHEEEEVIEDQIEAEEENIQMAGTDGRTPIVLCNMVKRNL